MFEESILVEKSLPLNGEVNLSGAKNAVLVIMTSLLLTSGKSILRNIPASEDVFCMIELLQKLGVEVNFDIINKTLYADTSHINNFKIDSTIMKRMRASVLALGPLLARFGYASLAMPGGCSIGTRPINFHLTNFKKMGVEFSQDGEYLVGKVNKLNAKKLILEYPSVGATENIVMAATLTMGKTTIINAALEPEVLDLIDILKKMGANISILAPATIEIEGVQTLSPVDHFVMCDRLEAGSLLLAAAISGGDIYIPNAQANYLDVFLLKLEDMGHTIITQENIPGIRLIATNKPQAVSFKTMPYPGFPTDLQAPMMAALALAEGVSEIEETVYENRFLHAAELNKMGANIQINGTKALVTGVKELNGMSVNATDIRASCALVIAGLVASGQTTIKNIHHFKRGYDELDKKLNSVGAKVTVNNYPSIPHVVSSYGQKEI
ncbi:MAG: UDP-N-acetylglucosamine 1-carboxyvinyltransferase [Candidatus Babeliales bacterium]|nr:UDP-N-acetylglucosamine 1-carboxyvinyltransferase [Candidatus Babeliales bacterium]